MNPEELSPEARAAAHAAKNAQQVIEAARELQLHKAVELSAEMNREMLVTALKEVFGDSDSENPDKMKVLVRRIPILCTNIENMHKAIEDMRDNQKWVTRAIIGGVIAAVFALLMK